jgi:hypothetical protein
LHCFSFEEKLFIALFSEYDEVPVILLPDSFDSDPDVEAGFGTDIKGAMSIQNAVPVATTRSPADIVLEFGEHVLSDQILTVSNLDSSVLK